MEPSDKSVEIMRKFSEQYARRSGTYFCVDKGVTSVVIKVYSLFILDINFLIDMTFRLENLFGRCYGYLYISI